MDFIKGLFETHLFVENLERSAGFYSNTMDLDICFMQKERRAAFFCIGPPKNTCWGYGKNQSPK